MRSLLRRLTVAVAVSAVLVGATACSMSPEPTPAPTPQASVTPSEEPQGPPEPIVDGTADENRPYFDHVITSHIAGGGDMSGGTIAAVLAEAGWSGGTVEVTPDATPLGNATDAVSFAVRLGDDCLLGQWNGEYTSMVAPALASGTCLVGTPHSLG